MITYISNTDRPKCHKKMVLHRRSLSLEGLSLQVSLYSCLKLEQGGEHELERSYYFTDCIYSDERAKIVIKRSLAYFIPVRLLLSSDMRLHT